MEKRVKKKSEGTRNARKAKKKKFIKIGILYYQLIKSHYKKTPSQQRWNAAQDATSEVGALFVYEPSLCCGLR
jgi:hypothetical protein